MFVLKIFKVKRKKHGNILRLRLTWQTKEYFAGVTRTCFAEKCSKIFGKTYWKTRVQMPFSKNVSGCRPATLFEKKLMQRFFSVTFSEQLFYSIVQTWIAASDLIENLETLTISEHLRKSLNILTIIVDFTENIWDFSVTMKQSESRI